MQACVPWVRNKNYIDASVFFCRGFWVFPTAHEAICVGAILVNDVAIKVAGPMNGLKEVTGCRLTSCGFVSVAATCGSEI